MKRLSLLVLGLSFFVVLATPASAQQKLPVETFTLDNGLKVILCEDHEQPKVYGAVVVHAGSKDEKPTATGVAHYFEHMMFKGTDRIGTTNWKKESLYLDSISQAYDRLHATQDAAQRHDIQLEINRLNIAASQYAIPNEVDVILQKMGCTGLNAGTNYDYTVYYNTLPSNQLANWMDVYVERFRNPVFRLFQSELEAVYEEKNMYENDQLYDFRQNILAESFGEHPYSRDIIGLGEHLKNPQPSEMMEFFRTYYVANNMTLILVGDFKSAEAKRLVKQKFTAWQSGQLPPKPTYQLPDFATRKIKDVRQTPIKVGIMIFPGVKQSDPDYLPLEMLSSILGGGSGLLDRASTNGDLMAAQLIPLSLEDAGSTAVLYIPKLIGQSHEEAEEIVWTCIDSIQQGNFSDELIEAIKYRTLVSRQQQVENYSRISSLLLSLELERSSYDEWLRDGERWQNLTREDIIRVAKKYFDRNHCTLVRSKMGFPSHDAAVKPDWEHLEAQNKEAHSDFAMMIAANQPDPIRPQVIDINSEVAVMPLGDHFKFYSAPNPRNDVFNLNITYNYGTLDNADLDRATQYLSNLGTGNLDLQDFNLALDKLGGSVYISSGNDQSTLRISGLEENLDSILALVHRWLVEPRHDAKQIDIIVDGIKTSEKASKDNSDMWTSAIYDYVFFGDRSDFREKTPYKQWKKRTGEQLHQEVMQIFTRNGYVTYTGNGSVNHIAELLQAYGLVGDNVTDMPRRAKKRITYDSPQIFYASNRKYLQSDIDFVAPSIDFDTTDEAACILFNEYFGGGMSGIVFQEIREFRSLGYSTYGNFSWDRYRRNPARLYCFLGTQCDKTIDGIEAMRELIVTFPNRPEKLQPAIEHCVATRNSNYINFRSLPSTVQYWTEDLHWNADRRNEITEKIGTFTMEDMQAFHDKYIKGRPLVISISGNAKKFDVKALRSALGPNTKVTKVKYGQMFRY